MADLDDLLTHARSRRVAVIGGGVAGLVAARELAKVSLSVTVYEASERFGGAVRSAELDGVMVDVGADGFRAPSGALKALISDLGLTDRLRGELSTTRWVVGKTANPLPALAIAGIPANPFADDVRRIIGWGGAWRAYLDRLRPPLTIGHEHSLGKLVRTRMGEKVEQRLVAPLTRCVYGGEPDDIDAAVVARGLGTALTRTGSLSGAVFELYEERGPGASVTLEGGMGTLIDALVEALATFDVSLHTDTPITVIERTGSRYVVAGEQYDHVVIALPAADAMRLLASHVDGLSAPQAEPITVVTLLTRGRAADRGVAAMPLQTGGVDPTVIAAELPFVRWGAADSSERAPGDTVVRVRIAGGTDESDERLVAIATEAARELVDAGAVRAADVARFAAAPPASQLGLRERSDAVRGAVNATAGLSIAGAWVSGAGLGAVVADATAEADRVRSALLWRE